MKKHAELTAILALGVLCVVVWGAMWGASEKALTVSFLDVGQGDAIFIETPSSAQMLIDGGKNTSVLRELAKVMPWWDRTIDVVVATHPDADHIGGLVDVLERYRVHSIIESSVRDDGTDAEAFEKTAAKEAAARHVARRGEIIDFGDGSYFEILFPDRAVPNFETNTASIIGRLVYGDTAFMLTGDAPQAIEEYLVTLEPRHLKAHVLKAGHHGSKTSSSPLFVGYVNPEYAIFSRGCDNSYGHPHADVIALYKKFGVETHDTCIEETVAFVSDGQTVRKR